MSEAIVLKNLGVIDPESIDAYIGVNGYAALKKVLSGMKSNDVVDEIKKSGLRGRGGAGFPTGLKWDFTAILEGEKYIVCNADEGEPGTYKDRYIMEGDPHKLIEGMIIAGYAIGAVKGYIYIRGEYNLSIKRVKKAIEDAKKKGFLGENILNSGFSFTLEVKRGAGAYVCGEETSLINSIESKRGYPRIKPPFPGVEGLWQKPTVVNNVETLANVAPIILNGANWFKGFGTTDSPGTKIFMVFGDVNKPGIVEAEMGTSMKKIIEESAGGVKGEFKAALIGGAAGSFVTSDMMDIPLDYKSLIGKGAVLGSGAILVINKEKDMKGILKNIIEFFEHESCGQCFPCRLGCKMLDELMGKCINGEDQKENFEKMRQLSLAMKESSLCALGQSPYMPIESAYKYFKSELTAS